MWGGGLHCLSKLHPLPAPFLLDLPARAPWQMPLEKHSKEGPSHGSLRKQTVNCYMDECPAL